ncbi:MAG: hypothetical protein RIT18_1223, partial [Actinomycetota bacterium]
GDGDLTRYAANLLVPRAQRVEVALLKSMAGYYIIRAEKSQERYAKQQQVISDLVEAVRESAPETLESFFLQEWNRASTEEEKMRVVIDQVSSLTDVGAYASPMFAITHRLMKLLASMSNLRAPAVDRKKVSAHSMMKKLLPFT